MSYDPTDETVNIIGGPTPESPSPAIRTRDSIRGRIREFLAATEDPDSLREAAKSLGVLPLGPCDGGRWYGVRPDGDLLSFALRVPHDEREEDNPWLRAAELSRSSERYPELKALVPPPPLSCRTCPRCGGAGQIRLRGAPVMCICGGLGWLAPVEDEIGERKEGRPPSPARHGKEEN